MGAFFLYKNNADIDSHAVESVFRKKGFQNPKIFNLNGITLWLYKKQLIDVDNYIVKADGSALFATGTIIYKGLSYRESLRNILEDHLGGKLDYEELLGNYCLIFYDGRKIKILTDRLCSYHLFIDTNKTRISSSFLALMRSFKSVLKINQMAFYEKISRGYIIGPDTLVSSIQQISPELMSSLTDSEFAFIPHKKVIEIATCAAKFDDCVAQQIYLLKSRVKSIKSLADEYGADLGLSSGYDSRLLLLLCLNLGFRVSAHTHLTFGTDHLKSYEIVEELGRKCNIELRAVKTKLLSQHNEELLREILTDGLYYFDGRNSRDMGAFSETYTRAYKIRTLGNYRLSLNGQAGEIYRNYFHTSRKIFNFGHWMRHHAFFENIDNFMGSKKYYADTKNFIIDKINSRIEVKLDGNADLLTIRKYYGFVHVPDSETNINDAHNQLTFYLTPFIDISLINASLSIIPHIGISGRFETAMIKILDPEIAAVNSHYGFPFSQEPLSHKLKNWVKGYTPDSFFNWIVKYKMQYKNLGTIHLEEYLGMVKRSKIMREIDEALFDFYPNIDWHSITRDNTARRTVVFMGSFLREFGSLFHTTGEYQ